MVSFLIKHVLNILNLKLTAYRVANTNYNSQHLLPDLEFLI